MSLRRVTNDTGKDYNMVWQGDRGRLHQKVKINDCTLEPK